MSSSPFDVIPHELAWNIFAFLPPKVLMLIQTVCKHWNEIANQDGMWRERFFSAFHHWYDEIAMRMSSCPWRERFWKCYHLHCNWREARAPQPQVRVYFRSIRQIQVNEDYLAFSYGGIIEIRDPQTQAELHRLRPELQDTVPCLKGFHLNKSLLACAAGKSWSQINVYDLNAGGRLAFGWTAGDSPIETLAMNDRTIVTGSRKCVVWDLQTRTSLMTISEQQRGIVNCLQFDDKILACSHKGKKVRIWDINSGKRLYTLQGHQHLVHCLQYNDNILVTGSKDRTLRVWDKRKGYTCLATLRGHTESVRSLQLDDWKVISGSKDSDVRIWDIGATTSYSVLDGINDSPRRDSRANFSSLFSTDSEGFDDNTSTVEDYYRTARSTTIPHKSICRISGSDAIFSLAASTSRLYVGTHSLRVYDFEKPETERRSGVAVLDKLRNIINFM